MRPLLLALAIALLCAGPAYAGSSASNISTPSDPTFPVDDGNGTFVVSGHTDFDPIDIICTYGASDQRIPGTASSSAYNNISQQPGGNFAVVLPLEPLRYHACRLHAVPSGEAHPDLTTLTGPRIGVAYRHLNDNPAPYDYDLQLSAFGGYAEFGGSSDCGLLSDFAEEPSTLDRSEQLFDCSDSLKTPPANGMPRAAVQVDGQNAYFTSDLLNFGATSSPGNPDPALSVDPATGMGSVVSHEKLAACSPGGSFPPNPTSCHDGVADGIQLNHTTSETAGGALALVNDEFASSDGFQHTVDLWVQQASWDPSRSARAERGGNRLFIGARWQFPGDPDFVAHSSGDSVTGPALAAPGTALLDQEAGSAFGSLSWATPPDTISFVDSGTVFMHYSFTVPAGGSKVLQFAYGSAFTQGGASALGAQALTGFAQPAAPGGGNPAPAPPSRSPLRKLRARFAHVKLGGDGTVTLTVGAPDAGFLSALETALVPRSAKTRTKKLTVSRASKHASKAGTVKLVLRLNAKGRKVFRAKHRLPVALTVGYKPTSGTGNRLSRHLTLRLKKPRRR